MQAHHSFICSDNLSHWPVKELQGRPHTTTVILRQRLVIYPLVALFHALSQPSSTLHWSSATLFVLDAPQGLQPCFKPQPAPGHSNVAPHATYSVYLWPHWLQYALPRQAPFILLILTLSSPDWPSKAQLCESKTFPLPQKWRALA